MWIIQYFDWLGTLEELEKLDKMVEKHLEKKEGVKYKGRYGPHNQKFHSKCLTTNSLTGAKTFGSPDHFGTFIPNSS